MSLRLTASGNLALRMGDWNLIFKCDTHGISFSVIELRYELLRFLVPLR